MRHNLFKLLLITTVFIFAFAGVQSNLRAQSHQASSIKIGEPVDLGLSVLWSNINIGADLPTDIGNLYAWGDIKGDGEYYEQRYFNISGKSGSDVAKSLWRGNWRIPNEKEFQELIDKCKWDKVIENNLFKGYNITGPTGNQIFLPAFPNDGRERTEYWSGTNAENSESCHEYFSYALIDKNCITGRYPRQSQLPIRPIKVDDAIDKIDISQTVDLGLSVLWAGYNIGATNPLEGGNVYTWGQVIPNTPNYYEKGTHISSNKKYDAATNEWGGKWRIPTKREVEELFDECQWVEIEWKGKTGYKVIGKNGNSIFLMAEHANLHPFFWTGDFYEEKKYGIKDKSKAWSWTYNEFENLGWFMDSYKSNYNCIRAVCDR